MRVAQGDVASIPALLEGREADWPNMARSARQMFEQWLAPDVLFSRLADECEWLLRHGQPGRKPLALQLGDGAFRLNAARHYRHALRRS